MLTAGVTRPALIRRLKTAARPNAAQVALLLTPRPGRLHVGRISTEGAAACQRPITVRYSCHHAIVSGGAGAALHPNGVGQAPRRPPPTGPTTSLRPWTTGPGHTRSGRPPFLLPGRAAHRGLRQAGTAQKITTASSSHESSRAHC